jgi:hypothetical protein
MELSATKLKIEVSRIFVGSEERNRVDWRSTLRHAPTAKRRWERDIVRLLTLREWVGTAFGTAWFVEFVLSADEASLFRSVRPIHHRGDGEPM